MERDIANPGISLPLAKTRCGTSLAGDRYGNNIQSAEHYWCTPDLRTSVKLVSEFLESAKIVRF